MSVYAIIAIGRVTELLPGAANLPLAKAAFACAIIAVFMDRAKHRVQPLYILPIVRTGAALFVLAAFSIFFSIWRSNTLQYVLDELLTVFLSYLVCAKVAANWPSVRRLLRAVAFSATMLAVIGFAGYAGGRLEVTKSYDPNDLAYVLGSAFPLALAFGMLASGWRRWAWFGSVGLMIFVSVLTQSRGGFIGIVAIGGMLLWRPFPRNTDPRGPRPANRKLLLRALPIAAMAVVVLVFAPTDARERLGSIFSLSHDYNMDETNESGRMEIWKRNTVAAIKRPIGYGAGSFESVDGRHGGKWKAPHNSVLQVLVELGWLGLFLFIRMYVLAWRTLTRFGTDAKGGQPDPASGHEQRVLAHAVKLVLVGTFCSGFFLSQAFSNLLWVAFGAVAAMAALGPTPEPRRGRAVLRRAQQSP